MEKIRQSIQDSIHLDLCRRSVGAATGFAIALVLLMLHPAIRNPQILPFYYLSACIGFLASLARLYYCRVITKHGVPGLRRWGRWHFLSIILISTFVGVLAILSFVDSNNTDGNIFITTFLICAVMAGSASSISLVPKLQNYLLFCLGFLPAVLLSAVPHKGELPYIIWSFLICTFIIYVYINSKLFYRSMVYRYETEEALVVEKTNLTAAVQKLQAAQEELLTQKARAEYTAKLASLGEMAGGIAHEINTPLNVILLLTEQQYDIVDSKPFDEEAMKTSTRKIEETTNRIAKIVRGLRTFARDGQKDPIETVPLQSIIDNTLALCYEKFKLNNIEIRMDEALPQVDLKCRPVQVSQVFLNILNNASEAVSALPEKWISIDVKKTSHSVEIRFTDSGPGISSDIESKIFTPFFTTKEIGKGTGLGLSISRSLIDEHHGQIFVDREDPHTSFVVRLPV